MSIEKKTALGATAQGLIGYELRLLPKNRVTFLA